jgi:hypothetical protein
VQIFTALVAEHEADHMLLNTRTLRQHRCKVERNARNGTAEMVYTLTSALKHLLGIKSVCKTYKAIYLFLKGQCHEMVVEIWSSSLGIN